MMKILLTLFFILIANVAGATVFTDLKFSGNQVADTQWNVGSCLNTSSCQIYSKNPGPTYNTGSPIYPTSTQYISFIESGNATYPWRMQLRNSDGSLAQDLGTGRILVQGTASDGNKYFFFSNASYNGTLFSLNYGMDSSAGLIIEGTNSPTVEETNQFSSTGSTEPLSAGESGGAVAAPTPIYSVSMTTLQINQVNTVRQNAIGSEIDVDIDGSFNDVTIEQAGVHFYELMLIGDNNTVNVNQASENTSTIHFISNKVNGNNNNVDILQDGLGQKTAFVEINSGNSNTIDLDQTGDGNHFAEIILEGDNHLINLLQEGSGSHMAELNLVNNGGAWTVDLTQRGATNQTYSLPHDLSDGSTVSGVCYALEGCNVTLIQE